MQRNERRTGQERNGIEVPLELRNNLREKNDETGSGINADY